MLFWELITAGCYQDGHAIMVNKPERAHLGEGAPECVCEMNSSLSPEVTAANQELFTKAEALYRVLSAIVDSKECGDQGWHASALENGASLIAQLDGTAVRERINA